MDKKLDNQMVYLNQSTLVNIATSFETWKEILNFHHLLATDIHIQRMDVFYKECLNKFGINWRYLDIINVLYTASKILKPQNYLEIGVRRGRSLCTVVHGYSEVNIYAFDLWQPNYAGVENPGPEYVSKELIEHQHKGMVTFIDGNSHQTIPEFFRKHPDLTFDLITVDGDHTEKGSFDDLCNVIPRLNIGGIIVFDDITHPQFKNLLKIWRMVIDIFPYLSNYEFTEIGNGVAFGIRTNM